MGKAVGMNIRYIKDYLRSKINRFKEFLILIKEFSINKRCKSNEQTCFERNILLSAHSIEKGTGLRNFESGHGIKAITDLIERLDSYLNQYDPNCFAFKEGIAAIREYINCQKNNGCDSYFVNEAEKRYSDLLKRIPPHILNEARQYKCGAHILDVDSFSKSYENYEAFVKSRHTVRMFKNSKIDSASVLEAVRLANYSPSACNRQANRVYFTNDIKITTQIDKLITGNRGFEGEIVNYAIVTAKRAMFAGEEQFQWYIGGGIYLASFVYALHSLNIGTCIMQWRAFYSTEKELKQLCNISENEAIIAIVGMGEYDNNTKVIYAQRMKPEDTLTII